MTTNRTDPDAHDTDRQHRADVAAARQRLAHRAARLARQDEAHAAHRAALAVALAHRASA